MPRPSRLFSALLALALLAAACSSGDDEPPPRTDTRPNYVFILLDDLRAVDLEIGFGRSLDDWDSGVERYLIDEGTVFENFFTTTPLCCPSRVSYLTGRYAHNHGVYGNAYAPTDGNGGWRRFWEQGYEADNIGAWLQEAGYTTAMVGKYLNGYPGDPGEFLPANYVAAGWDEFYGTVIKAATFSYYDFEMIENGEVVRYAGDDAYLTDIERDHTLDFIRRAAREDRPFFVYLNPFAPHAPSQPAPRHAGMHAGVPVPQSPSFNEEDLSDKPEHIRTGATVREVGGGLGTQARWDMTLAVDEMIAAIVEELEAQQLLDNTYIFLASDNGLVVGEHSVGGKSAPYEESIRIPMLIRGPGVGEGATLGHLAGNIDVAPTLLDLAGAPIPPSVDGESLAPLLTGADADWRDGILIELRARTESPNQEVQVPRYYGVRTATHVYVEYITGEMELYDLGADPFQMESVHDSAPAAILDPLRAMLAALSGCSGSGCAAAARLDVADAPGMDHHCVLLDCMFRAIDLVDPGPATSFTWDFGDGSTASGAEVEHSFVESGAFAVTLTAAYPGGERRSTRHLRVAGIPEVVHVTEVSLAGNFERRAMVGTVAMVDGDLAAAAGVEVTVSWIVDGERRDPTTGTTEANGKARLILPQVKRGDTVEMCVTAATHPSLTYEPRRNLVTCASAVLEEG